MIITSSTPEPYLIDEFDFTLTNGILISVAVDRDHGDSIDYETSPLTTIFHIVSKPSPTNAKVSTISEDITVFMPHVVSIHHRTRLVQPISVEQKDAFQQTLIQLSSSIQ